MWLFVNNQHCFGYIQITTLNNKNTFGAPYLSSFDTHPRWLPVTQSARSRRSYGKLGTVKCEQSVVACIRFGSVSS